VKEKGEKETKWKHKGKRRREINWQLDTYSLLVSKFISWQKRWIFKKKGASGCVFVYFFFPPVAMLGCSDVQTQCHTHTDTHSWSGQQFLG